MFERLNRRYLVFSLDVGNVKTKTKKTVNITRFALYNENKFKTEPSRLVIETAATCFMSETVQ